MYERFIYKLDLLSYIQKSDNIILQKLLEANLNPYKLYQFNKMPHYVMARPIFKEKTLEEFLELLNKLSSREITGNDAEKAVINFFNFLYFDTAELFEKILLKSSFGVGTATVNKIWANLVPDFKVMLAPNQLADISKIKYPCYVENKLDGYRCVYIPNKGFYSRSGKTFGNTNLNTYFKSIFNCGDYVLDGELYVHGLEFQKFTSIVNTENIKIPNTLKFVVYDCVPLNDWINQECNINREKRLKLLREVITGTIAEHNKILDISVDLVYNSNELKKIYKEHLQNGYEGSIIKSVDGLYQWKRVTINSGEMLKLKPFKTLDLEVKAVYSGEGNFKDVAGGITVNYNGIEVSVGSGFNLETRKLMKKNPTEYIGKIAEIKYFEETVDRSLRFPTFVRWRFDK